MNVSHLYKRSFTVTIQPLTLTLSPGRGNFTYNNVGDISPLYLYKTSPAHPSFLHNSLA